MNLKRKWKYYSNLFRFFNLIITRIIIPAIIKRIKSKNKSCSSDTFVVVVVTVLTIFFSPKIHEFKQF